MKKGALFLSLGLVAILGSGCASTHQTRPLPDQTTNSASTGKARIYVLRQTGVPGFIFSAQVFDGEHKIGKMATSRYLCWERDPGKAEVRIEFIIPNLYYGATVRLDCQAGETYYLKHELKPIAPFLNLLSCVPAEEALKSIRRARPPKVKTP